MIRRVLALASLMLTLAACEGGFQPSDSIINHIVPPAPSDTNGVLRGTLHFRGTRPPPDSIIDFRVVAFFRKYPLDSIATALLSGQARYTLTTVPVTDDSSQYTMTIPQHHYGYIAVAQQWGPNILSDWRAVGVYAPTGDVTQPGAVEVVARDTVTADILVDWDHLPPN